MISPFSKIPHRRVLVSDFDGTITRVDFYERVLELFPHGPAGQSWQEYREGTRTQFEGLQGIFSVLPADASEIMKVARTTGIDERFATTVKQLDAKGWAVVVASTGCQWYIDRILDEACAPLPVVANPGKVISGGGLHMTADENSPYYCSETGVDKAAIVREALSRFDEVAFAGNGKADLPAILLVPPRLRFARDWLARRLEKDGEGFQLFERWSEIAAFLT